jgi:hypothetical protein
LILTGEAIFTALFSHYPHERISTAKKNELKIMKSPNIFCLHQPVIPAKAGIQRFQFTHEHGASFFNGVTTFCELITIAVSAGTSKPFPIGDRTFETGLLF